MPRKVIQLRVDEELLNALESLSKKLKKTRSELVRLACQYYLKQVENEKLDKLYQQGYEKTPEDPGVAEAQVALLGQILPKESW